MSSAFSGASNLIVQRNVWEIKGLVVKKEQGLVCAYKDHAGGFLP